MTVTVRPAIHADVAAITRIYAHAVEHGTASFELTAPDRAEMTRRFNELTTNGFPYLVAVGDGTVLGYAYAGPYRTRPAYRFTVENSVYVAPASQRRGVGKALHPILKRFPKPASFVSGAILGIFIGLIPGAAIGWFAGSKIVGAIVCFISAAGCGYVWMRFEMRPPHSQTRTR